MKTISDILSNQKLEGEPLRNHLNTLLTIEGFETVEGQRGTIVRLKTKEKGLLYTFSGVVLDQLSKVPKSDFPIQATAIQKRRYIALV